ncbi:MAG: NifB/NifX family molybdenum-iron cluster-binding protein [Eubacteriales bacterium]|nr:NifB/NifX family molybdenum-iron cluster-binding protein [Eubacteriales bacterium]
MYIAVAADGVNLESNVSKEFGNCKYLLIVSFPDLTIEVIENSKEVSGEDLARKIIDYKCEAVITETLTVSEFDILADACITRFFGYGNTVKSALDLMDRNMLRLIRNHEGTDTCGDDHHHSK